MTIEPVALAGFREAIVRDAEGRVERHFLILCFAARWSAGEPVLSEELDEARWLDPAELADLADHGRPRRDRGGGVRAAGGAAEHVNDTGPQRREHAGGGIIRLPCFRPLEPRQCLGHPGPSLHVGANTHQATPLHRRRACGRARFCAGRRAGARPSCRGAVRRQPAAARGDPRRLALSAQHLRRQRRPEVARRDAVAGRRRGAERGPAAADDRELQSRLTAGISRVTARARRRPSWSFAATSKRAPRSRAR